MGPRHEVCWIWGDDMASEQDAALAGSGPGTAAAQQVSAPQAAVNALLSDPALPTDRLVLEVDIKTCTILAVSPGADCFYKQSPFGDMRGQVFASFVHGKDLPILLGLLDGGGGTAKQIPVLHWSKQFSRGREIKGAAHEQISSGSVPRGTSSNEGCDKPRVVGAIRGFRSSLESQNDSAFRSGAVDKGGRGRVCQGRGRLWTAGIK